MNALAVCVVFVALVCVAAGLPTGMFRQPARATAAEQQWFPESDEPEPTPQPEEQPK